ncbi:MAG: spore maturation protein CgeB [Limimaricola cinnabarinus]|jgi:spore maturation protein CgeB|uniref:CgeB family protein n=1 Tax=Limimaricola cinnabarinus TaxID=1125964 RepID=UPI0039E5E525
MTKPLAIVIFGLSLSSSWGNGHATTYRGLLRGLAAQGHRVLFLERDMPWYATQRDLPAPDFCEFELYDDLPGVLERHARRLREADAVIVGSYVPQGVTLIDALAAIGPRSLCFYDIDTPVTLAKLRRGDEEYLAARQIAGFDIYLSFSGGEVLRGLERDWRARRAEALYCSVDADRYAPTGAAPVWDLGYLGTYSPDRQPVLERLLIEPARRLPDHRFVVAGPQYPDDIDWPANVERIDHLPPEAHPGFYSRQRWTLNVTRADMVAAGWSPSVRLFEAAACATPIISDRWRGLDELFPEGRAIEIADGTDQVVALLEARDETARQRIADRARRIVLEHHTGAARSAQLARMLEPAGPTNHRRTMEIDHA